MTNPSLHRKQDMTEGSLNLHTWLQNSERVTSPLSCSWRQLPDHHLAQLNRWAPSRARCLLQDTRPRAPTSTRQRRGRRSVVFTWPQQVLCCLVPTVSHLPPQTVAKESPTVAGALSSTLLFRFPSAALTRSNISHETPTEVQRCFDNEIF